MKKYIVISSLRTFGLVLMLLTIANCSIDKGARKNNSANTEQNEAASKKQDEYKAKPVSELSQDVIRLYSKTNSCYLPLLKDSSLYNPGSDVGVQWQQLFNDSLSKESKYKNRYLVGDFMALNEALESRGIAEKNPERGTDLTFLFKYHFYQRLIKFTNQNC